MGMAVQAVKTRGFLSLYNGLTASLTRQVKNSNFRASTSYTVAIWRGPPSPNCRESVNFFLFFLSLQLTYSSVRFGVYEILRPRLIPKDGGKHVVNKIIDA